MKLLLIIFAAALLTSCGSTKKAMNAWLGHSRQDLILKFGPPAYKTSDENGGQIYVYDYQFQNYNPNGYSPVMYRHIMYYINSNNQIYYWRIQTGAVPAEQMNVNLYVH